MTISVSDYTSEAFERSAIGKTQAGPLACPFPSLSVSNTRPSAASQVGIRTPNVSSNRRHDSRELAGRFAGRGNSLVLIGIRFGSLVPLSCASVVRNDFANPNQLVYPAQVRL